MASMRTYGLAFVSVAAAAISAAFLYQKYLPDPREAAPIFRQWESEIADDPLAVANLERAFAALGYDFTQVRSGRGAIPRVLVRTVPNDLGQVPEVARRKALFLGSVLPLVLSVNEQITRERATIEAIAKKIRFREELTPSDTSELDHLAKVYRVIDDEESGDISDVSAEALVDELLLRVAPLPVSLVLAQAAEESAWGLSRFALEGNALYGQWVWNDPNGIVPKDRSSEETHSIKAFRDILESTLSYAHNLNTHRAYADFRKMRANMLNSSGHLDGHSLAGTLTRYSGRGQAYVESLRNIIRANNLTALDRAQFSSPTETRTAAAGLTTTVAM